MAGPLSTVTPFPLAIAHIRAQAHELLGQWGARVVDMAKEDAPVDTGYMRDHIRAEEPFGKSIEVVSEAEYSGLINYGGLNRPARPFFSNAVESVSADLEMMAREVFIR